MAAVALQFLVHPVQGKVGIAIMLERLLAPLPGVVAAAAIGTKAPLVHIASLVAFGTLGWQVVATGLLCMTCVTRRLGMPSLQRVIGFLRVVKAGSVPLLGRMTAITLFAEQTTVTVLQGVAGRTFGRRCIVLRCGVATGTGHVGMSTFEGKVRFRMIKLGLPPILLTMAILALLTHLTGVDIIISVAVITGRCSGGKTLFRKVAAFAGQTGMRALEWIVRELVLKHTGYQPDNIGLAPLVVAMTLTAGGSFYGRGLPMKALHLLDIGIHVFVAGTA